AHVLQTNRLLIHAGLRGGDVLGPWAGLQGGQLGLGASEGGTRLEDGDLGVVLLEHGQRVAGLDAAADVDQQALDAAGALGQHADLLAGADIATVGEALLDITTTGGVGRNRRGGRGLWGGGGLLRGLWLAATRG